MVEIEQHRLIAENVQRIFKQENGEELVALKDFNLEVTQGEIVALIGPSGCGKSTFLRLVAGLDKPQGGTIIYDGKEIEGPDPDRGFVFQEASLYPWLTVHNNIAFGLKTRGLYREQKDRVQEMIDLMGLTGFEKSYPHQLSGGMASRAALAQTFILNPSILMLDEPLSALDAFTRAVIQDEILTMCEKFKPLVLLVTYDIEEAVYLADRVVVLSPRPGTNIVEIPVEIPHPRDRTSLEFIAKRRELMEALEFE